MRHLAARLQTTLGLNGLVDKERVLVEADDPSEVLSLGEGGAVLWSGVLAPHPPRLFDFQQEVLDLTLVSRNSRAAALLSLPTGAGKTRTAMNFVLECKRQSNATRAFWIAPSVELVDQAVETLRACWDMTALPAAAAYCDLKGPTDRAFMVFGSLQGSVPVLTSDAFRQTDLLVFDEAHRASAHTYSRIVRSAKGAGAFVLGLSATPGRATTDGTEDLVELFESNLIVPRSLGTDPIAALRARGVLAELELIEMHNGVSAQREEEEIASSLLVLADRFKNGQGLGFARTVEHAYAFAAVMAISGIQAEVVAHGMSPALRRDKINRFRSGKLSWLWNVELLSTGVDLPTLSCIALCSPMKSSVQYEQVLGRASRGPAVGGSPKATVFDYGGNVKRFGDARSYWRYLQTSW